MGKLVLDLVLCIFFAGVAAILALGALFGDVEVTYPQDDACGSVAYPETIADDSEYSVEHRQKACDGRLDERRWQGIGAGAASVALLGLGIYAFVRGLGRRRAARVAATASWPGNGRGDGASAWAPMPADGQPRPWPHGQPHPPGGHGGNPAT